MSTATGWTHMNASLELPRKSTWYKMLKGDSNETVPATYWRWASDGEGW